MKIRLARAALGWSQTELAQRVGLTQRAIYRLESASNGCRKSTVRAIDAAFKDVGLKFQLMPDGSFSVTVPASVLTREMTSSEETLSDEIETSRQGNREHGKSAPPLRVSQ